MDYRGYAGGGMEAMPEGGVLAFLIICLIIVAITNIVALWKLFNKAKQPGWAAIVPIYNGIIVLKIAQRPLWWIILFLIPFLNTLIFIIVIIDFIKLFGKQGAVPIALAVVFPYVYIPIIAFSRDTEFVASIVEIE